MTLKVTKKNLLWLAGLIEGDGCFFSQKKRAVISLSLTDKDIIEKAAKVLKTTFYFIPKQKETHKNQYGFQIKSEKAISVMKALYPYMGQRRQQKINEVLEKWEDHCRHSFLINKKTTSLDRETLTKEYKNSSHRKLAAKYDVSFSTIQRVLNGSLKRYSRQDFPLNIEEDGSAEGENWLAGFLEAEGSFLKPPPSSPNSVAVTMQTTDEDVAQKVANLLTIGYGKYQPKKLTKSGELPKKVYIVILRGKRAVAWMLNNKPLMSVRRQQQITDALLAYDADKDKKARLRRCVLSQKQVFEAELKINKGLSLRSAARDLKVHHTVLRSAIIRKNQKQKILK